MSIVQGRRLIRLADLNVLKLDLGQENGAGEQVYLVGCWRNIVHLQQVSGDLTNADPIELRMVGANPGRSLSGAQWAFNGTVYCAYNDGTSGVIQIRLNETFFDTPTTGSIFAARVKGSAELKSKKLLKKVPVDFKIYTHYSGHYSYTSRR